MKLKYNNISKGLLACFLFGVTAVSCSDDVMDRINENVNNPTSVAAKFVLADVLTKTSYSIVGGDFSTYLSIYTEQESGVHNQMFRAETRGSEPYLATTFNNGWGSIYENLKNAQDIIKRCSPDGTEPGNKVTLGIGQVMMAYNLAVLTDLFGDVPWTEACDFRVSLTPKVDKQEDIYKDIFATLDAAIVNLNGVDQQSAGQWDFIYNGSNTSWLRAAHGLKARYTMRLLARSANKPADLQKVLDYVALSFESAAQEMKYNKYNGLSTLNPIYDFQWSRDGLGSSASMANKLIERLDPRFSNVFMTSDTWAVIDSPKEKAFLPVPNGTGQELQYYYNQSLFMASQTAPTQLLSYHELLFLKAEALTRLGRASEAETVLQSAIAAAFANTIVNLNAAYNSASYNKYGGIAGELSLTVEDVPEYFATSVKPLFDANPLKEVMVQKYLAFFGANGEAVEAFNDLRRLRAAGENFITLANPGNGEGHFPLRCPYGADDVNANPNVKAAFGTGQYVFTENVWWAGGSR